MRAILTALARSDSGLGQVSVSTSPYNALVTDRVITLLNGSGVVNLPDLSKVTRDALYLMNASSAAVTINAYSGDTVEGQSSIGLPPGGRFTIIPNA